MASRSDDECDVFSNSSIEENENEILSNQVPERGVIGRVPCKKSIQLGPRFIASERNQLVMVYSGYKLYQKELTNIFDESNRILHTEVTYRCRKPKCRKRIWMKIPIGATEQIYDRETVESHNHDGDPLQMEVDVAVDQALKLAIQNPMATNRSIIAAVTEGMADEVRFLFDTSTFGVKLSRFKEASFYCQHLINCVTSSEIVSRWSNQST
uniref:FLYWCH-type domain-containing protein n=1 Tax=Ditylenchus dipsaci TaxID=166011 RepID=A0A915DBL7_9BILA